MKKLLIRPLQIALLILISTVSLARADAGVGQRIFTSGRIGMTHSVDLPAAGELYFLIGHRFGDIGGGLYDLFGLDLATIRLGFDYGINDLVAIGIGRSTWEKSYDIFSKIAFLRQSETGSPVAVTLNVAASVNTMKNMYPEERDGIWNRSSFSGQIMIARVQNIISIMNRRDVIRYLTVGGATIMVLPLAINSCTKKEDNDGNNGNGTGGNSLQIDLTASSNSALTNPGGFIIVSNTIIVNTGGGNYIALSSVCTHSGCQISYNPSTGNFPCGCHGSVFSQSGSVLNGPALNPLTVFPVTKTGNILTIKR